MTVDSTFLFIGLGVGVFNAIFMLTLVGLGLRATYYYISILFVMSGLIGFIAWSFVQRTYGVIGYILLFAMITTISMGLSSLVLYFRSWLQYRKLLKLPFKDYDELESIFLSYNHLRYSYISNEKADLPAFPGQPTIF